MDYVITHHGIKGQKWGIRRYQPYENSNDGAFKGRIKEKMTARHNVKVAYRTIKKNVGKVEKLQAKKDEGKILSLKKEQKYEQSRHDIDTSMRYIKQAEEKVGRDYITKFLNNREKRNHTIKQATTSAAYSYGIRKLEYIGVPISREYKKPPKLKRKQSSATRYISENIGRY